MGAPVQTRQRFCGFRERVNRGGAIPRWDQPAWDGTRWVDKPTRRLLRWTLDRSVPTNYRASIEWAWAQWAKVCAIYPTYVSPGGPCEIVYQAGSVDGPSNTLAWAELPIGSDAQNPQLDSRIDTAERWHLDPTTRPARGSIHLGGVMCHENGHLLGLDHDNSAERALLDPTYGDDVLTPQRWDIAQAVVRYGDPFDAAPEPDHPDVPTPPGKVSVAVTLPDGRGYVGDIPLLVPAPLTNEELAS